MALGIALGFLARWILGPPISEDYSNRRFKRQIETTDIDPDLLFEHDLEIVPLGDQ